MIELDPKQERAITALLSAPTHVAAARVAEISEATLYRWLQEPEFKAAYRNARREALEQATTLLHRLAASTVTVLFSIVKNEDAPPHARVSAASKILDMAYRSAELVDVQQQIDDLKKQLGVEA